MSLPHSRVDCFSCNGVLCKHHSLLIPSQHVPLGCGIQFPISLSTDSRSLVWTFCFSIETYSRSPPTDHKPLFNTPLFFDWQVETACAACHFVCSFQDPSKAECCGVFGHNNVSTIPLSSSALSLSWTTTCSLSQVRTSVVVLG